MGAQIIKRKMGEKPEIITIATIDGRRSQISFNSDGHLIVRYIYNQNDDTLIVFDSRTSQEIKNFCQHSLKSDGNEREIPF